MPVRDLAKRLVDLIRIKESVSIPDIRDFDEELLRRILSHLRVRTGHDFSKYKRSTVLRRVARRMQVSRTDGLKEYYDVMRDRSAGAAWRFIDLSDNFFPRYRSVRKDHSGRASQIVQQ